MTDFITLSCPTCGSKLQITPDIDRFSCLHCGNEHVVRRGGGLVSIAPVVAGLQQIRTGVDKTAAELALVRLPKEIALLEAQAKKLIEKPAHEVVPASGKEGFFMFFAIASLSIMGLALAAQQWWAGLFLVSSILCGAASLALYLTRVKTGETRLNEELGKLDHEIDKKQALLAHNRQLLES